MAKQAIFDYEGRTINFKNAGEKEIKVGDVVSLTSRIGVALEDIAVGSVGGVRLAGVWTMPAVNNAAFEVGDQLYWDSTNKKLTKVDSDAVPAGMCVTVKAANGIVASVLIG